ncbi:hypothetical protein IGI04_027148 [Brassica rapa subsp. trilocularis]|uniref:Uncharacterized protein n=1 Tax=Brassica rapa subsp. trilocularis TaxID=1813537 RepID=A0ABQ7KYF1_BRACM|nr:hypothetical protein IGI04_027148 [Brassica rapa subsp. trilocularis]
MKGDDEKNQNREHDRTLADDEQNRSRESNLTLASATPKDEQNRNPRNGSGQILATADPPARALIPLLDEVGPRPVRRYKRFTAVENKAIEDGYKKYGPNWSLITQEYSVELAERSETTPLRVIFHHEASLVEPITTNFPRVEKYLDVVTSIVRSKVKLLNESSFASCGKIEDWVSAYKVTDLSESCKEDTMKKLYHKDPSRRRDGAFFSLLLLYTVGENRDNFSTVGEIVLRTC